MKIYADISSALCAIIAAVMWIRSARVEIYADGQTGPLSTNLVIEKNGRKFDVTATVDAQSRWSAYAAYAAAASAALQARGLLLSLRS